MFLYLLDSLMICKSERDPTNKYVIFHQGPFGVFILTVEGDLSKSINLKLYILPQAEGRRKKLLDYSSLETFFTSISKANIASRNLVLTNLS